MLAVTLTLEPNFSVTNPVVVNRNVATGSMRYLPTGAKSSTTIAPRRNWDLTGDGRFVGVIDEIPAATASARQIDVTLNWVDELKQRVLVK
jgi:hypothetical protein